VLKDNRLLIGLGLGIIIGAILLELMNAAISGVEQGSPLTSSILDEAEYSVAELREIADSLDYKVIEKSVVLYTQSQLDDALQSAEQTVLDKPAVEEPVVVAPIDIKTPAKVPIQEEITESNTYKLTIKSGMTTKDVTQLLIGAGLIDDAESFEKELSNRKLNNKIQVGDFNFLSKPSLTELINEITSSP